MKLFAATRSKRKVNNPVSFDEKRAIRRSAAVGCSWIVRGSYIDQKTAPRETPAD